MCCHRALEITAPLRFSRCVDLRKDSAISSLYSSPRLSTPLPTLRAGFSQVNSRVTTSHTFFSISKYGYSIQSRFFLNLNAVDARIFRTQNHIGGINGVSPHLSRAVLLRFAGYIAIVFLNLDAVAYHDFRCPHSLIQDAVRLILDV